MSILTFNEACSFVKEIVLSEKLYESESSCIFVEIDPTAGIDDIDRFCSFVNHNNSVNLVIVGILNCSDDSELTHRKVFCSMVPQAQGKQ